MPEELTPQERLETRLHRLEQEIIKENRWWRGGLIAALVLIALAIFTSGHHRRPERGFMAAMGGFGWAGPGGMPGYGPYPPPPHPGFGWGGPCGPGPGNMAWGPKPWSGQPREWNGPGPGPHPQGQSQSNQ